MQDLSKWSYADDFTPVAAACLIVGLEPTPEPDDMRVEAVMRRMEKAYTITLDSVINDVWGPPNDQDLEAWCPGYAPDARHSPLTSVKLEASLFAWEQGSEEIKTWLNDKEGSAFHKQRFSAQSLGKWVDSSGLKSAFSFVGPTDRDVETDRAISAVGTKDGSAEIRFGRHTTGLLRTMVEAKDKHWSLWDPADKSTAPTNEVVIKWLMEERGVPKRIAEIIATILRPEGIPVGRR